jgi:hypothetical protein
MRFSLKTRKSFRFKKKKKKARHSWFTPVIPATQKDHSSKPDPRK